MPKQTAEIDIQLTNGNQAGKTMNQLTSESVKLNREIKKLEIGSDEWVKKTAEYKQINGRLKEVKKEVYATEEAQGLLNSTLGQYIPFNSQLQKFVGTYNAITKGIKGATVAQRLLNAAFISSGVGAIVVLFGSLIAYLTTTQKGMDTLTRYIRPVTAIFERLLGIGQELGAKFFEKLSGWVSNPMDAIKQLGKAILDNIINRFTAITKFGPAIVRILKGELLGGFKDLTNAAIQMGSGIEDGIGKAEGLLNSGADAAKAFGNEMADAAKKGRQIADLNVAIEEKQNDMIISQARLNRQIAEQSEIARDASKTDAERQAAAQKAIELLDQRTKAEDDLLAMQIKKMEIEQTLNDTDRKGVQEMNQLIAQRESNEERASRERVRLNSIANKDIADSRKADVAAAKKASDEKAKQQEEYSKKVAESEKALQDLKVSLISDEQDRKIAEINLAFEREIEAFEGNEAQKTEFLKLKQQERDAAIQAVKDENAEKALQKELKDLDTQNEIKEQKLDEQFYSGLITEEERNQQLYDLQKTAIEERLALLVAAGQTETAQYQSLYTQLAKLHYDYEQQKTKDAEKFEKARASVQKQGLDTAKDVFSGFEAILSRDEEARRKNFGIIKAFKLAEMKINLLSEISAIWETANSNPGNILFPGFGNIIAIAKTIAATTRFAAGAAQVASQSYALGGPVKGPSHQAGGIGFSVKGSPVRHEMEGDEIILSKGVYRDPVLRSLASDLNVMGGGRSFAMGGPVLDRGFVNTSPSASSTVRSNSVADPVDPSTISGTNRSEQLLEQIAANTYKSANTPPPISIQRVRDGLNTLSDVENEAKF